jgi:hypothetical protein
MALVRAMNLAVALALGSLLCGACATVASAAGSYDVEICTAKTIAQSGVVFISGGGGAAPGFQQCGNPTDGGMRLEAGSNAEGFSEWTLTAPEGTLIHSLSATRTFPAWNHVVEWIVQTASSSFDQTLPTDGAPPPEPLQFFAGETAASGGPFVAGRLSCLAAGGCRGADGTTSAVTIKEVVAHMEDLRPPGPPTDLAGPLTAGAPVRGSAVLSFKARDEGSGIAEVMLLVDGVKKASQRNEKGGDCLPPYTAVEPCSLSASGAVALDTTKLSEGAHRAEVVAVDASGQRTPSAPIAFTVKNAAAVPKPPLPAALPPVTKLTKKPKRKAASRRAKFSFTSDQAGSSFQCKLDRKPFAPCRSPFAAKVKPGRHTFQVRAIGPTGIPDPSPVAFHWMVPRAHTHV